MTTQTIPANERAFISLQEAAQEIGCTRRFLERRIEDGEITVFRPSKRLVRIARRELTRWIESYSHGGKQVSQTADGANAKQEMGA